MILVNKSMFLVTESMFSVTESMLSVTDSMFSVQNMHCIYRIEDKDANMQPFKTIMHVCFLISRYFQFIDSN